MAPVAWHGVAAWHERGMHGSVWHGSMAWQRGTAAWLGGGGRAAWRRDEAPDTRIMPCELSERAPWSVGRGDGGPLRAVVVPTGMADGEAWRYAVGSQRVLWTSGPVGNPTACEGFGFVAPSLR